MKLGAVLLLAAGLCFAETVNDHFQNLDFHRADGNNRPRDWRAGGDFLLTSVAASGSCHGGRQCALLQANPPSDRPLSFLYQTVNAVPYRGKRFNFRADVRTTGTVQLVIHVHGENGTTAIRRDLGAEPIPAGDWGTWEVEAPIPNNAVDIEFGVQLQGAGAAYVDNIALTFEYPEFASYDDEVRALIRQLAYERNLHNGSAVAALYSDAGAWAGMVRGSTAVRGRSELAALWSRMTDTVDRMIETVDFVGVDVAEVSVTVQYGASTRLHHERFVVVREGSEWKIRAHRTLD